MHIKTGSWEAANAVCDSDSLCDPAVLVSAANTEPQIRNRRLSPGSGNGGGGGGGCMTENNNNNQQHQREISPESQTNGIAAQAPPVRKEKERKAHKGRSSRRESQRGAKERKTSQKERWVEDSLSLLKPPPAFPVQDSPAKLQPAVSYASKVKAGAATGGLEEDRPAIGVLLQNQWGLSFISEARPPSEIPDPSALVNITEKASDAQTEVEPVEDLPSPAALPLVSNIRPSEDDDESNSKLLLSCRHLVEALKYHRREWNAVCNREKKDPKTVVWYVSRENPA